jgi:beta-1,4-mannosyltransferase
MTIRVSAWFAFKSRALNPYNGLLYDAVQRFDVQVEEFSPKAILVRRYDVFHVHWPDLLLNRTNKAEVLLKSIGLFTIMEIARRKGAKIIWTVHNLQAHERLHPRWEQRFWREFIQRIDGYIALTRTAENAARERFPALQQKSGFVIPIGHFRDAYTNSRDRLGGRRRFGIPSDARVIAFVGFIRPYKNVPVLIDAFRRVADPGARLLIAGRAFDDSLREEIRARAGGDSRIVLHLEFLEPNDLDAALNAADLVVLPFREVLNSASALLALSFNRPVLVPNRGSLPELVDMVGARWVKTYEGAMTAELLVRSLGDVQNIESSERPSLDQLDWTTIATRTVEAYRAILDRGDAA